MKHILFTNLALILFLAGSSMNHLCAQQPTAGNVANLIRFESSGCRGNCPQYKFTVRQDGTLEFVGIRQVEKKGTHTVRLSSEEYAQLIKEVRKVDLWQYPALLPATKTDPNVHTFTVFEADKTHTVTGSSDIPAPILALETLLQDIAESHDIVVRKGHVSPDLKGQAIVRFAADVNARDFCTQFTDLKVRPISHVSEDNTWIIGYNPSEVTEQQFISLLKGMNTVMSVEPNKQVQAARN